MKHCPKGVKRAHLNLTPASSATLKRLVGHLEATHPDRRVTASSAIRYAVERTAGQFDAVAAL